MTLDEAIKELGYLQSGYIKMGWETEAKAAGLGIEALKRRKSEKEAGLLYENDFLPGETKE